MATKKTVKADQPAKTEPHRSVLAIAAHPDDIEFTMAGTLFALAERGWRVHYLNVSNGNAGSMLHSRPETAKIRLAEAKQACKLAGFIHYAPFAEDQNVLHDAEQIARTLAVVRASRASIVLTQSLNDYMEDHQNAARLAATAAFSRGMKNVKSNPQRPPYGEDVAVYHAMPHGLRDSMGKLLHSGQWVDVSAFIDRKGAMLACHASQKDWLDATQGMDSYIQTMEELCRTMGKMSGKFKFAEGWRRHNPLGYSADLRFDPLTEALGDLLLVDKKYAKWLDE